MRKLLLGVGVVVLAVQAFASSAGAWVHPTNSVTSYRMAGPPPGPAGHCKVDTIVSVPPQNTYTGIRKTPPHAQNCGVNTRVCTVGVFNVLGTPTNGQKVCTTTDAWVFSYGLGFPPIGAWFSQEYLNGAVIELYAVSVF